MSSILIVDDEEDIRNFLALVLEEEGFAVRAASGGMEALLMIQKEKPQVVLLDLMMPQITGEELCRVIKNDPDSFDIHIIVLSARSDTETKVSCFESGADEYLVKPIDARELVARMKSFFRLLRGMQVAARSGPVVPGALKAARTLDLQTDEAGTLRIRPSYGNFRVESLVGSGGMGHVFRGRDHHLDRAVAVKVLSRSLSKSPRFVERFRREAKILASADHPGIAGIYTFGEEGNDFYFAMQWCPGGSVEDLIHRKGRVELMTSLDIMIQCVDALDAALNKGIVHRDIKPSNLMFDQNQRIKIVDFGLATFEKVQGHVTQASEIFGTPDYMAPEQAQFGDVDHRADIYSLGITFYLLLYGKLPFTARSPIEMVVKHATEEFPEYDPLDGAVPREAYEIIVKMTRKLPTDRYQDYAECRADLQALREEIYSSTGVMLPVAANIAPAPIWKSADSFEILSALYVSPHAGILEMSTVNGRTLRFLVENRHILFLDAADAEERIWKLLAEAGLIQKSEIPPGGSDFRDHLMRFLMKRAFGFEDVKRVYRQYLKGVVVESALWKPIGCVFYTADIHHDDLEGLFIGDALLDLARGAIPYEEIWEHLESNKTLVRTPEFDQILTSLSLNPEESFVASRIESDHGVRLEELCLMTGFAEEKVARFLFVLLRIGACQWKAAPSKHAPQAEKPEDEPMGKIAEQFFELARKDFDAGKYWKATELCKQAIQIDPSQGKYYHLMAQAYEHHPRFLDDAEQCLNKAIELEPRESEYHLALARFYLKQGLPAKAQTEVQRAREVDPDNPAVDLLEQEIGS